MGICLEAAKPGGEAFLDCVAASDDYYTWWLRNEADNPATYHLCIRLVETCLSDAVYHIGAYRLLHPSDF